VLERAVVLCQGGVVEREQVRVGQRVRLEAHEAASLELAHLVPAEQRRLAAEGKRVRVLISYGSEWFAWYMRRLAERPANLWFALRAAIGS